MAIQETDRIQTNRAGVSVGPGFRSQSRGSAGVGVLPLALAGCHWMACGAALCPPAGAL